MRLKLDNCVRQTGQLRRMHLVVSSSQTIGGMPPPMGNSTLCLSPSWALQCSQFYHTGWYTGCPLKKLPFLNISIPSQYDIFGPAGLRIMTTLSILHNKDLSDQGGLDHFYQLLVQTGNEISNGFCLEYFLKGNFCGASSLPIFINKKETKLQLELLIHEILQKASGWLWYIFLFCPENGDGQINKPPCKWE